MQEPPANRPIDKCLAGPGFLAPVLVAKYADHLPLYRQSEIYAREGVELDRSTMSDWVGASGTLEPRNGKAKTGRLWAYVRDDRPAGGHAASAVWLAYSPHRRGEHPSGHLKNCRGIPQADGYEHVRRKLFDLHEGHASPLRKEALARIAQTVRNRVSQTRDENHSVSAR